MKKFERFIYKYNGYGIKNLMLFVVIANVIVFLLAKTDRGGTIVSYFLFIPELIKQGQVWRLITFVFVPQSGSLLTFALSMYFYYWIGNTLEREWGVLKFNIYYFTGIILTALFSLVVGIMADATYLNMSMFFAFATLYPNVQVLLFFILPIKIKYLAFVNVAFFAFGVVFGVFPSNMLPIVAVLNYVLYFYEDIIGLVKNRRRVVKNTVSFKQKINETRKTRGYIHKCTLCGKTDTENPQMEFRYCSLCKDYACYCEEHIMTHDHI